MDRLIEAATSWSLPLPVLIFAAELAVITLIIRIITNNDASNLIGSLRQARYGVTTISAQGATGPVQVIYTMIRRKQLADVVRIIKHSDPTTFYSVEDLRSANGGIFQIEQSSPQGAVPRPLRLSRAYFPLPIRLAGFRRRSARIAERPATQLCPQNLQTRAEPAQMARAVESK